MSIEMIRSFSVSMLLFLLFNIISGEISLLAPEQDAFGLASIADTKANANPSYLSNTNDVHDTIITGRSVSRCGLSFQRYGGHKIVGGRSAMVGEYP